MCVYNTLAVINDGSKNDSKKKRPINQGKFMKTSTRNEDLGDGYSIYETLAKN